MAVRFARATPKATLGQERRLGWWRDRDHRLIASSTRRRSISPTTHDTCSPGEFPAGSRQPAEARLGARCDQLVVGADRARAERLDEFVGNHRRERIAAADIPRKLVPERNRIASLRPRTVTWGLCPAVTDEPEPSQTLMESLEHSHVRLATRRREQVRVPLFRPPLRRVTHGRSRERVRLRKLHHCMVDGVAASDLLAVLLDLEPREREPLDDQWLPAPVPSTAGVLAHSVRDQALNPMQHARSAVTLGRDPRRLARAAMALLGGAVSLPALSTPHDRSTADSDVSDNGPSRAPRSRTSR